MYSKKSILYITIFQQQQQQQQKLRIIVYQPTNLVWKTICVNLVQSKKEEELHSKAKVGSTKLAKKKLVGATPV